MPPSTFKPVQSKPVRRKPKYTATDLFLHSQPWFYECLPLPKDVSNLVMGCLNGFDGSGNYFNTSLSLFATETFACPENQLLDYLQYGVFKPSHVLSLCIEQQKWNLVQWFMHVFPSRFPLYLSIHHWEILVHRFPDPCVKFLHLALCQDAYINVLYAYRDFSCTVNPSRLGLNLQLIPYSYWTQVCQADAHVHENLILSLIRVIDENWSLFAVGHNHRIALLKILCVHNYRPTATLMFGSWMKRLWHSGTTLAMSSEYLKVALFQTPLPLWPIVFKYLTMQSDATRNQQLDALTACFCNMLVNTYPLFRDFEIFQLIRAMLPLPCDVNAMYVALLFMHLEHNVPGMMNLDLLASHFQQPMHLDTVVSVLYHMCSFNSHLSDGYSKYIPRVVIDWKRFHNRPRCIQFLLDRMSHVTKAWITREEILSALGKQYDLSIEGRPSILSYFHQPDKPRNYFTIMK